jgi:glutathione S-transferase
MPVVHGVSASPYVRKVRVALAEKGVPYDQNPVMPFGPNEEYRKISPLGKIPTYEDDGKFLNDSSVIIAYLEKTKPEPALYPSDPYEFARALWFEEYGDSAIAAAIGGVFIQKIVGPMFLNQPTDQKALDNAWNVECPKVFDYLESQLKASEAIAGTRFSVGDIGVATHFVNLGHAGYEVPKDKWPKLAAYVAHQHARPSFKALIDEERALFGAATK